MGHSYDTTQTQTIGLEERQLYMLFRDVNVCARVDLPPRVAVSQGM